jgi:hypothetical protein
MSGVVSRVRERRRRRRERFEERVEEAVSEVEEFGEEVEATLETARPRLTLAALGAVKVAGDAVLDDVGSTFGNAPSDAERRDRKNKYNEEDLRGQFLEAFEGTDYPIEKRRELYPALPDGVNTTFESNGNSFGVVKLYQRTGGRGDFPYDDPETLTEDLIDWMRKEGYVE